VIMFEGEICHNRVKVSVPDYEVKNQPDRGIPRD